MPSTAQAGFGATVLPTQPDVFVAWDGVERVLMETRSRILGALDRELDQIRATYQVAVGKGPSQSEFLQDEVGASLMAVAPLPDNVVTVSRELFVGEAPQEAVLDPELEKATVEELNAALADAFNHVSAR